MTFTEYFSAAIDCIRLLFERFAVFSTTSMKQGLLIILILTSIGGYSQEWWDLKYHEGSDAGIMNNNSALQGNLHRDPKARNKDNVETKIDNSLFVQSKETKKRIAEMNDARKRAFEKLKENLASSNGKLIQCVSCVGRGANVCNFCHGNSYVECSVCHGAPNLECRACKGGGLVNDQVCKTCEGTGKSECKFCQNKPVVCAACVGVGNIICKDCSGEGMSFEVRHDVDILSGVDSTVESGPVNVPSRVSEQEDSILKATYKVNSQKSSIPKKKSN